MTADVVITAGFRDKEFRRSLYRWGGYSRRAAWMIAKDFERAEQAKERVARESAARMRRGYTRLQQAHQVMTTAIVAGLGVVGKSLQEAAKQNRDLRAELESAGKAASNAFAELGEDIGRLNGGLDSTINKLAQMRRGASDFVATLLMGGDNLYEVNYQLKVAQQGRHRFESAVAAKDVEAELFGSEDDPDRRFRQNAQKKISSIGNRTEQARLRARLDQELKRRAEDRQRKTTNESARDNAQRHLDLEARRLQAIARRNPEDYQAQQDAINAHFAAKRKQEAFAIRNDDSIAEPDKYRAIQQAMRVISAEQAAQLENAQKQNELEEKRLGQQRRRQVLDEAAQRVELERARGNTKEAEAMAAALELERRRLAIMEDQTLSVEQRARMLANEQDIYSATVAGVGRGGGGRSRPSTLGAGFAGDATTIAQVIGVRTEQKQLVEIQKTANTFLQQIEQNTRDGQVARVG